jgi:hypothetical protein
MFKNHRFSTISNQVNPTLKCFRLMFDVSRCLKKKSQDICIAENIEVESNKESKYICITRLENAILQVQARFVEQRRQPRRLARVLAKHFLAV